MDIDLDELKSNFQHEIGYFREYLAFNIEKLALRKETLYAILNSDILEKPQDEEVLRQIYHYDFIKIPGYFYHSSIVSIYSLLENNLSTICDKIQTETSLVIGLNDLVGSNILQKARKFLVKFANVNFTIVDKEWQRITEFQKLRNLIVHQNSQIKKLEPTEIEMLKTIKKFKGIEIDVQKNVFIVKDEKLLIEFLKLVESFISYLHKQVGNTSFNKFELFNEYMSYTSFIIDDDFPDLPVPF